MNSPTEPMPEGAVGAFEAPPPSEPSSMGPSAPRLEGAETAAVPTAAAAAPAASDTPTIATAPADPPAADPFGPLLLRVPEDVVTLPAPSDDAGSVTVQLVLSSYADAGGALCDLFDTTLFGGMAQAEPELPAAAAPDEAPATSLAAPAIAAAAGASDASAQAPKGQHLELVPGTGVVVGAASAPAAAANPALDARASELLAQWSSQRDCRILARWYPHLVNRIAKLWDADPRGALACVRDLQDDRHGAGKDLVTGARLDLAAIETIAALRVATQVAPPVQATLFDGQGAVLPPGAVVAPPVEPVAVQRGIPDDPAVLWLKARHPHIIQRLEQLWDEPLRALGYLDSLLFPDGRKRSGFSDDALRALWALKELVSARAEG